MSGYFHQSIFNALVLRKLLPGQVFARDVVSKADKEDLRRRRFYVSVGSTYGFRFVDQNGP